MTVSLLFLALLCIYFAGRSAKEEFPFGTYVFASIAFVVGIFVGAM